VRICRFDIPVNLGHLFQQMYLLDNLGNPALVPVSGTPWPQIIEMIPTDIVYL
jgi:hypothetical protein